MLPGEIRPAASRQGRQPRSVSAVILASVTAVEPEGPAPVTTRSAIKPAPDGDSREWLSALRGKGTARDEAIARLHTLLLRAARFEIARRRPALPHLRGDELGDIALEAADDALVSALARLDDYRGDSRFTTWVYKFALLEAAVKLRRRAWQGREVPLEPEKWSIFESQGLAPEEEAEMSELLNTLRDAIETVLSPHQRKVVVALALNGVPIDVLAERLDTTRGALYKTLHDARQKLRRHLTDSGLGLDAWTE
jgi:RNA polymerase sigma-70 factor, ECF subfamily